MLLIFILSNFSWYQSHYRELTKKFCQSYNVPEKAMALYSGTLAWKIPWTEEPGGLQSMGSLRVGHD